VAAEELAQLRIEISVLSEPKRLAAPDPARIKKAGLSAGAWRHADSALYIFQADSFAE